MILTWSKAGLTPDLHAVLHLSFDHRVRKDSTFGVLVIYYSLTIYYSAIVYLHAYCVFTQYRVKQLI